MRNIVITETDNFEYLKRDEKKLIIAFFHAAWCGPCRALTHTLESIDSKFNDVTLAHIDIDEAHDLVDEYNIHAVPTLIFIKNNYIVGRISGAMNSQELINKINSLKDN